MKQITRRTLQKQASGPCIDRIENLHDNIEIILGNSKFIKEFPIRDVAITTLTN